MVWNYRNADCTYTHPFNGPLSETTQVSRYQIGKTNLDFTEARNREWQWNPLGHMQVCTSLQTDNHTSTPPLSFFTSRMPFLPPNQQRQSTEGNKMLTAVSGKKLLCHFSIITQILHLCLWQWAASVKCGLKWRRPLTIADVSTTRPGLDHVLESAVTSPKRLSVSA